MNIFKCFIILSLFAFNFSSYAYVYGSNDPYCPYAGTSSVCKTYAGNACPSFAVNYQPEWFSACALGSYAYLCAKIPTGRIASYFQRQCVVRGTPCVCSYPNGYYETGLIN